MILGLTGYHGSGKSKLAELLSREFGWNWIVKRDLFERLFRKEHPEGGDWVSWYRELYREKTASGVMEMLFSACLIENNGVVLLDGIHNSSEWSVVRRLAPGSMLIGVFTPERVRADRNIPEDDDVQRRKFWHEDGCLLSEIEWAFAGCSSDEVLLSEGRTLFQYLCSIGALV